jgi:ATP-dependent DNA helicase DinG
MDSIVALDIETTGLDPDKDAIIEIGAVRFSSRRVEDEWSTLINPGRPIPPFITQLTGINDQMVREMPNLRAVINELKDFVGDAPVLGHNIRFDLAFLRKNKILLLNETLDTYEMASVLMPTTQRYNLGALAQTLNIPILDPKTNRPHRALVDANLTRMVYQRLSQQAMDMPLNLLAEIVHLGDQVEWDGYRAFQEALRARSRETISARQVQGEASGPLFRSRDGRGSAPLNPNPQLVPLDLDEVSAVLEYGGAFSQHFPHYEYRPQQVEMIRAVTQALCESQHYLIEAGTGTGKSLAYLIPAARWAMQNNARVVVSTNTINLQDQLINKDIPDLCRALGIDLRAAILKGRGNYLCPRRLENMRRRGPQDADEVRVLAKVMVWLQNSQTGDRGEINLNGPSEREVWGRLCAEDEGCTSENCLKRTGGNCPFYRARQAAQCAHVLVVNHALLLADVATGNRVLPDYEYLIIDEAHHLEEATTNALSFEVTQGDIERTIRDLGGPNSGALGWLLTTMMGAVDPSELGAATNMVQRATDYAFQFENSARRFFENLNDFLYVQREGKPASQYSYQERILPSTRTQPAWTDVELAWDDAAHSLRPLEDILGKLLQGLAEITEDLPEESEDMVSNLGNLHRRLTEYLGNLNALVFEPAADRIYWAEVNSTGKRLSLHAAPLHIGPMMEKVLWHEKSSVILTSATLTTAGEFEYLRGRLYAEDARELALGSPFDYETAALVYLVNDIPEPSDRFGHQKAIESGLIQLCKATGGRTLVLFTSYDQLKRTSQAIGRTLRDQEIQIYEQGEGASPHSLLESFRTTERAVLLGTRSFWEGVDVPGDALSVLAIVKLPFDVPSDPIVAARSETFEDPFNQYSLPEAILRFRQGFGRLIRTQYDRGVVAVFDKRIITKRYGQAFLDSLPKCTLRKGPLASLPRAAAQWLNL